PLHCAWRDHCAFALMFFGLASSAVIRCTLRKAACRIPDASQAHHFLKMIHFLSLSRGWDDVC
ncbi:MAG: hypothetical protein KA972_03130, partial [Brachymonas sp.]|nr:hypothetical protein [Brachymonas sp.]